MKSYKEIAEVLKGKQHKLDKNKNGKLDAHDFKLLRKEEAELSEATVKTQKYSWGTMKTVHHGADFSIPLHPEHHQAIAKLKDEQEHKFKTEDGKHWTARRKGDEVHFQGANNGGTTKVKHSELKESEDRMARSDYSIGASGNKSHKEIVFKDGEDDEEDKKEEMKEAAPPGFEGTVKAMKKKKEIDNPYALAWSMYKKGYKSHKKEDGTMKEETEIEEQAPVAPVPDRKYIKGTPEYKAYMASKKPRTGAPTNVKEGYVVRYNNTKSEKHGSEKHFDNQMSAQKHADRGNSVDKIGGKYTVHKTNEKGHDMKEEVEAKLTYKEFMEAMNATQVRPGVTRYTGGSYGSAKGAKYGNTDYDKETLDTKDDEGTEQQKRGRGRPAGAKSGARGPRIK